MMFHYFSYHEHDKESNGPDGSPRELEHNLRVRDEDEPRSGIHNLFNAGTLAKSKVKDDTFLLI